MNGEVKYNMKVPLGYRKDGVHNGDVYIYNHNEIVVKLGLAPNRDGAYQIVGFEVEPKSINHDKLKKA